MALPGEEYGRRDVDRIVHGILRHLRRPLLCLQEFRRTERFSLSERKCAATNAALSSTVSLPGKGGETAEFDRSVEYCARGHAGECRAGRLDVRCRDAF